MGLDEFQSTSTTSSSSSDIEEVKTATKDWDEEEVDIPEPIVGNLLGDAEIRVYDDQTASFICETEDWDYLFYLKQQCPDVFYDSNIRLSEDGMYYIRSSEEYDMRPVYKKWYRGGEKELPRKFQMTPDILRYWYMNSGELEGDEARVYANWMSDLDSGRMATILRSKISNARIEREKHPISEYGRFRFWHNAHVGLFKYIGECPVTCYKHKWLIP